MAKYIKNNINNLFLIYLFLQPVLDITTAIMINVFKIDFTIGTIVRGLFLIFILYYIFFIYKKNKAINKYLIFVLLFIAGYLFNIIYTKGFVVLDYEAKQLIKLVYFPIILVFTYILSKEKKLDVNYKTLTGLFILYSSLVFIPNILGIGFSSYEITKSGTIGFFYTANEIGGIMSILMPFFIYSLFKKKSYFLILVSFIILFYILTSMGTKSPLLSFLIIIIYYVINSIKTTIVKKNYKRLTYYVLGLCSVILIGLFLIPRTNFYKNIVVHLDFLEVKSVKDIVTSPKKIDHFIFSERLSFLSKTRKIYKKSPISSKLLGIGYIDNYSTDEVNLKTIEMDFFDIYYRTGLIGFIIIMMPYIYLLCTSFRRRKKSLLSNVYVISILLGVLLSLLTGHILTSPSVAIYIVLILNIFYNRLYEEKCND